MNSNGHTSVFTVTNTGLCQDTYSFTKSATGTISGVTLDKVSATLASGAFTTVTATYNVGLPGSGVLTLTASGNTGGEFNNGTYNVTVTPYQVSVTPDGATGGSLPAGVAGLVSTFTVKNTGQAQDTWTMTCQGTGGIACSGVNPSSVTLAASNSTFVNATYSTSAVGNASVKLTATSSHVTDTGSFVFPVIPYVVVATPDSLGVGLLPSQGSSQVFTVRHFGGATATYNLTTLCTGTGVTNCSAPSPSQVTLTTGGSATATVSFAATATAGATGKVRFLATQTANSGIVDSGWVNVTVGTMQKDTVLPTADANLRAGIERDLCLAVATGEAGASECGDLRIVHVFPPTRTLSRTRAPMLVYNSQQAQPYPLVAANVVLPAGAANPDSVVIKLRRNGQRGRGKWLGSGWQPGRASRIVVADTVVPADTTGIYNDTLEIINWYTGAITRVDTAIVRVGVVNRSKSAFGAGWWLDGLERLYFPAGSSNLWWVGGDGSLREYVSAGTNLWRATPVDRPDSITKDGSNNYWRYLPHKAKVQFNSTGKHVATINRLGHQTTFWYRTTTDTLDSILLPPSASGKKYTFAYTAGRLTSVTAPPIGAAARLTNITVSNGRIATIRNPQDVASVIFGYGSSPADTNRIVSRTDRRGTLTSYFFDAGKKLVKDSLNPGASGAPIVMTIRPLETYGLIMAIDTAYAYAQIDGPRTDVSDTTGFWLDRFGAPRRVRNALGYETRLYRADANWPALVTKVIGPTGRITSATYDAHGNISSQTDSSVFQNGQYATTAYGWDLTWDFVTTVAPPQYDSSFLAYDAITGNRLWQQDRRGTTSRVTFGYTSLGLLSSIQAPLAPAPFTIGYNALGNDTGSTTPRGIKMFTYPDAVGRDTLVKSPIDSLQTLFQYHHVVYDLLGRDTLSRDSAASVTVPTFGGRPGWTVPAQFTTVRKHFDANGNLDTLSRSSSPDDALIGSIKTSWTYDLANRRIRETAPDGYADTIAFDPAGNATWVRSRRDPSASTWMTYDVLNHLVQRRVNGAWYPDTATCGTPPCIVRFPFHYLPGPGMNIPPDTATFSYDSAGNLATANNHDARIVRRYNKNGSLAADTLRIRTYAELGSGGDTTTHVYGLRYGYDLNGRRRWMKYPGSLAPVGQDSVAYGYDITGQLDSIRDVFGNRFFFFYDLASRLDSLAYPGNYYEKRYYDGDGRLLRRLDRSTSPGSPLNDDTLLYDASGRVLAAHKAGGTIILNWYSGLGMLARAVTDGGDVVQDDNHTDPLGNATQTVRYPSSPPSLIYNYKYQAGVGRQLYMNSPDGGNYLIDSSQNLYDHAGNRYWHYQRFSNYPLYSGTVFSEDITESYYRSDGQLRYVEHLTGGNLHSSDVGVWEEYRYDALGRRILLRARRDSTRFNCGTNFAYCPNPGAIPSYLERIVYDGNQVLYEIRAPGGDQETVSRLESDNPADSISHPYGRVGYVNGPILDRPLEYFKSTSSTSTLALVVHYSWRGLAQAGTRPDGASGTYGWIVDWPALAEDAMLRRSAALPKEWYGNVIEQQRDQSTQLYMRNRYYDPETGRFTQEDPIGLAGGLNLYGFAAGDPINFSDPFGLCVPPFTPLCLVAYGIVIGVGTFVGTRVAYNAATGRPLAENGQSDIARGALAGAATGVLAGAALAVSSGGGTATAFEIAAAGGRHAGLLRNYAGRAVSEIQQAVTSLEGRVAEHLDKIANPGRYVENWGELSARAQQGMLDYWAKEAATYGEQAEVLKGLLK